jgi:hypothetical protein|tara:strand:- start:116 stop:313 length:198 start_codon:yes stop_codon:yes gene_type:complete
MGKQSAECGKWEILTFLRAHLLEVVRGGHDDGVVGFEEPEFLHVQGVADGAHLRGVVQGVCPVQV